MNNKKTHWGVLALITFVIALLLVLPALPRPKARPQRIQTVNRLASASIILLSTNAPATTTPNK